MFRFILLLGLVGLKACSPNEEVLQEQVENVIEGTDIAEFVDSVSYEIIKGVGLFQKDILITFKLKDAFVKETEWRRLQLMQQTAIAF